MTSSSSRLGPTLGHGTDGHPEIRERRLTWLQRRSAWALVAVVAVVLAAAGFAINEQVSSSFFSSALGPASQLEQLQPGVNGAAIPAPASAQVSLASVTRAVRPQLVVINTVLGYQQERAAGTGMVLTPTGLVLTNNHVIEGETQITATDLGNHETYRARVLGYDRSHDVALIQLIGASGLPTVTLADSSLVQVGAHVVAIGNAGGTGKAKTAVGVISGLGKSITATDSGAGTSERLNGLLQTTARVLPGDSGGPLVDAAGHVLGMDTAGSTSYRMQGGNGAAYAIPISDAAAVAEQIATGVANGAVHVGRTALLGVGVDSNAAQNTSGTVIGSALPGGPAARAGLRPGDTIVEVDGHPITSPTALTEQLVAEQPGNDVSVRYVRDGIAHTTTVLLTAGPPQ
jgi:S1-C subfamily serine protease